MEVENIGVEYDLNRTSCDVLDQQGFFCRNGNTLLFLAYSLAFWCCFDGVLHFLKSLIGPLQIYAKCVGKKFNVIRKDMVYQINRVLPVKMRGEA